MLLFGLEPSLKCQGKKVKHILVHSFDAHQPAYRKATPKKETQHNNALFRFIHRTPKLKCIIYIYINAQQCTSWTWLEEHNTSSNYFDIRCEHSYVVVVVVVVHIFHSFSFNIYRSFICSKNRWLRDIEKTSHHYNFESIQSLLPILINQLLSDGLVSLVTSNFLFVCIMLLLTLNIAIR